MTIFLIKYILIIYVQGVILPMIYTINCYYFFNCSSGGPLAKLHFHKRRATKASSFFLRIKNVE